MKKKIIAMLCIATCIIGLLCGCEKSSDKKNASASTKDKKAKDMIEMADDDGCIPASIAFSSKYNSIWYNDCDAIDKNERPQEVLVFWDGQIRYYDRDVPDYSWGELSKMSDDEIVSKIQENFTPTYSSAKEDYVAYCDMLNAKLDKLLPTLSNDSYESHYGPIYSGFSNLKLTIQNMKSIVENRDEPANIKYTAYTDGSGNSVIKEVISITAYDIQPLYEINKFIDSCINHDDDTYRGTGECARGVGLQLIISINGDLEGGQFVEYKPESVPLKTFEFDLKQGSMSDAGQCFDSYYGGFILDESVRRFIRTRIKSFSPDLSDVTYFTLDDTDAKGVEVK